MQNSVLIVAAGSGTRAGGPRPKQYQSLGGVMILTRTINAFLGANNIEQVVVVINPSDRKLYNEAIQDISDDRLCNPVDGGNLRAESVKNGLAQIDGEYVLIHDAARPFVTNQIIQRVIEHLHVQGNCFLALRVTDALWREGADGALQTIDRGDIWRAQTPQAFITKQIIDAHDQKIEPANDDVAVAVGAGLRVTPLIGSERNFKITFPDDFARGEKILDTK